MMPYAACVVRGRDAGSGDVALSGPVGLSSLRGLTNILLPSICLEYRMRRRVITVVLT